MYRPNVKAYVQNLDWSHSAVGKNNIFKYLVANVKLFGYLFFNSYIGTVLRLIRSRFIYNISVGFARGFVGWMWVSSLIALHGAVLMSL